MKFLFLKSLLLLEPLSLSLSHTHTHTHTHNILLREYCITHYWKLLICTYKVFHIWGKKVKLSIQKSDFSKHSFLVSLGIPVFNQCSRFTPPYFPPYERFKTEGQSYCLGPVGWSLLFSPVMARTRYYFFSFSKEIFI